jgi:AN1-type zinc finger protein 2
MDFETTACSFRGCAERNDFLPFTCNGCSKKFCLDHHKSDQHNCPVPPRDDKYAPTCPMCQQVGPALGFAENPCPPSQLRA